MSQEFDCHYGEAEFNTIKAGIEAIEAVLTGSDIHAKERLEYAGITFLVFLGFLFVGAATDPNPAHLQHI